MKIEKRGIRITELPGGATLETQEAGTVSIQIPGGIYSAEQAREIRDALNVALGEDAEQRWDRIEDVPKGVTAVRDKDGDRWRRQPTDGDHLFAGETFEWLNRYAPFRRA